VAFFCHLANLKTYSAEYFLGKKIEKKILKNQTCFYTMFKQEARIQKDFNKFLAGV
jgi:hypothetical protein